ncbi:MAG: SprT-like domain-containing protein, partial [Gammaproteobacteria bacterium]|nr:SprT-like domain-containing protein [Gammaproteobacteria bacterium]
MIEPINEFQKKCVIDKTNHFIDEACKIYQRNFEPIAVDFDLKGRISGMYRRKKNHRVIRYNPYIFAKYFEDSLETTIPHEVAHYITDMMFNKCRPHGNEWRKVMQTFGADARRTCDYDL